MSEAATRIRSARQMWAAPGSRRDRVIATLRTVLPILIGVLAAFMVGAPLTTGSDSSFLLAKDNVAVAKQRLKIEAATYRGEDSKGQPFALRAGSAVQQSSARPVVQMNDLAAEIRLPDGPADITAPAGLYNMDTEKVALDGPIDVHTAGGYTLTTRDATVDLKTRTMQSQGPAQGTTPQGSFSGDRMSANLENRTVSLDGNVRLRIVPGNTK